MSPTARPLSLHANTLMKLMFSFPTLCETQVIEEFAIE